jgi:hypothetical protein
MKVLICFFLLLTHLNSSSQKVVDNYKIGKKEFEFVGIGLFDNHGVSIGSEAIFRFPLKSNAKLGGGIFLKTDDKYSSLHYGMFIDVAAFIGLRQKWSVNGDLGYNFFNHHHTSSNSNYALEFVLRGNLLGTFSINYRAILSKKSQIVTGAFVNFMRYSSSSHYTYFNPPSEETRSPVQFSRGGGIRLGFIL